MNRWNNRVYYVLVVVAVLAFSAWPIYNKWRRVKAVDATLYSRARALVEKNRQLQPAWDNAMQDGVLTWPEAKEIVEQAGEELEPEK